MCLSKAQRVMKVCLGCVLRDALFSKLGVVASLGISFAQCICLNLRVLSSFPEHIYCHVCMSRVFSDLRPSSEGNCLMSFFKSWLFRELCSSCLLLEQCVSSVCEVCRLGCCVLAESIFFRSWRDSHNMCTANGLCLPWAGNNSQELLAWSLSVQFKCFKSPVPVHLVTAVVWCHCRARCGGGGANSSKLGSGVFAELLPRLLERSVKKGLLSMLNLKFFFCRTRGLWITGRWLCVPIALRHWSLFHYRGELNCLWSIAQL